jgi:hypothetical protein
MRKRRKRKGASRKVCYNYTFFWSSDTTRCNLSCFHLPYAIPISMPSLRLLNTGRREQRLSRPRNPPGTRLTSGPGVESRGEWLARMLEYANRRLQSSVPMDIDPPFDATALGLKEIGNLASWTVSSCKPGCGVEALRDEDTNMFWQ